MLHWNCDFLQNKIHELKDVIMWHQVNVAAIQEFTLGSEDAALQIEGYYSVRKI